METLNEISAWMVAQERLVGICTALGIMLYGMLGAHAMERHKLREDRQRGYPVNHVLLVGLLWPLYWLARLAAWPIRAIVRNKTRWVREWNCGYAKGKGIHTAATCPNCNPSLTAPATVPQGDRVRAWVDRYGFHWIWDGVAMFVKGPTPSTSTWDRCHYVASPEGLDAHVAPGQGRELPTPEAEALNAQRLAETRPQGGGDAQAGVGDEFLPPGTEPYEGCYFAGDDGKSGINGPARILRREKNGALSFTWEGYMNPTLVHFPPHTHWRILKRRPHTHVTPAPIVEPIEPSSAVFAGLGRSSYREFHQVPYGSAPDPLKRPVDQEQLANALAEVQRELDRKVDKP